MSAEVARAPEALTTSVRGPEILGGRLLLSVDGARVVGPPLLLTVEEAASLLRLGRTRVYQLVMGGSIRSVKVGRRRLVVRQGLEEFVAQLVEEQAAS